MNLSIIIIRTSKKKTYLVKKPTQNPLDIEKLHNNRKARTRQCGAIITG